MIDPTTLIELGVSIGAAIASGAFAGVKLVSRRFTKLERDAREERAMAAKLLAEERAREREDRIAERLSCEQRFLALSSEIREVRAQQAGELAHALRESSVALSTAAQAQREGNAVLNRVCSRLEGLPCARDAAERRAVSDPTPPAQMHA